MSLCERYEIVRNDDNDVGWIMTMGYGLHSEVFFPLGGTLLVSLVGCCTII